MQLSFDTPMLSIDTAPREKNGVIYTRAWVVKLILDLAGYVDTEDLASRVAVEPAAGEGAFLIPMVKRLVASCKRHGRSIAEAGDSIRAYELDEASAAATCTSAVSTLVALGTEADVAQQLVSQWVSVGDYLLTWTQAPPADFIVGNPPYIRLEDIPTPIAQVYRKLYRTMVGRADLYVGLFEAALQHLKPDGVCGFICADRWMLNHYGTELRRLVSTSFSMDTIIEMHRADAFDSQVSAYPAITIIRKAVQQSAIVASAGAEAGTEDTTGLARALRVAASGASCGPLPKGFRAARIDGWFQNGDPWPCTSPERLALLKRLESELQPLEDPATGARVGIGVATGADRVFITRDDSLVEPSRLLPLALGPDTRDGVLRWSGHYLVDPWEDDGRLVDLSRYPRLREYFETHRDVLVSRHIAARRPHHWYRTIDAVHHAWTDQPKLYLPDIKGTIHPVLDSGGTYPHHNLYVVQPGAWDIEILGGLLLSSVAQFFIECYAVRMRGGWLRYQAQYLRRIRVPSPMSIPTHIGEQLKAAFRLRNVNLADAATFQLFGLSMIPRGDDLGY